MTLVLARHSNFETRAGVLYCKPLTAALSAGETIVNYDSTGYSTSFHFAGETVVLLEQYVDLGSTEANNDTYMVSVESEGLMELSSGINHDFSADATVCVVSHTAEADFCPDTSATFCTLLSMDAGAGDTSLSAYAESGFAVGDAILVSDGTNAETNIVVSVGSLGLQVPLANDYAMGTTIVSKIRAGSLSVASSGDTGAQASSVVVLLVLLLCVLAAAIFCACMYLFRKRRNQDEDEKEIAEIEDEAQEKDSMKEVVVEEAPPPPEEVQAEEEVAVSAAAPPPRRLEYEWLKKTYGRRSDIIEVDWESVHMRAVEPPPMSDNASTGSNSTGCSAKDFEERQGPLPARQADPVHGASPPGADRRLRPGDIVWDLEGPDRV